MGAVLGTAGKVVDYAMNPVGAVISKLGEFTSVVGGGLIDAFNPFTEPDVPRNIPHKIQQPARPRYPPQLRKRRQPPRPKTEVAHRKRGDLSICRVTVK